jgi:eukaryotic-like serine/threonine-protein kinase
MSVPAPRIGQILGHYRIVEQIGAGGMGVVYRAHDEQLNRDVALKMLPVGTLSDEAARTRFRKEALALAKLDHPNVATIHEFGSQNGVDFLVTAYVPGITLDTKLESGALPEAEVISLGIQLAQGLAAAHEHGVIHRDLKPGNLRLTPDGWLKILDFGLAQLIEPESDDTLAATLTKSQEFPGTLPYMAPEQLRGQKADVCTDIWSAGAVLYEMATGERPFKQQTALALAADIIHNAPPAPRSLQADMSSGLEAIIRKCLEKEPRKRYQSAKELAVDLQRPQTASAVVTTVPAAKILLPWRRWLIITTGIAVFCVLALLFALNVGGWRERLLRGVTNRQIESLAVLPLQNLSGDPDQDYFADGMTEELIADLSKIGALRVISRTSVMHYKGTTKTLPEIAQELKVDAVVEGSVRHSGDQVRITAQLIYAPTDRHLWAESYERRVRDVLALQSEVASAIASEIKIKITPQEQSHLSSSHVVNPDAYEAYLKGRYHWNQRRPEELKVGLQYFRQAIEKDQNYASAYSGLADSYFVLAIAGSLPASEAMPKAKTAALKALQMDDTLAEAHASLGVILENYDWKWMEAEREFKRAIELNPNYSIAHHYYAGHLMLTGRSPEAIAEMKRATRLDPLSPIISTFLGRAYYYARQYDQAIAQYRRTFEIVPNFAVASSFLVQAYEQKGMYEAAIEASRSALIGDGQSPEKATKIVAELSSAYKASGAWGYWHKRLNLAKEESKRHPESLEMAYIHTRLAENEQAFAWLERAYEEHDMWLTTLKVEPKWDSLRSDPRFQDLLRRVGLPQ